jgi:hypothetical protein
MATREGIRAPEKAPVSTYSDREIRARSTALRDAGLLAAEHRFPKTAIVLEAAGLADQCRVAASALDSLAAHAADFEPCTLRRKAHGIVRALLAEVSTRVVLAVALLFAVACGGSVEPEPAPVECVAVDFSGVCGDWGCVRDFRCNGKPDFDEAVTCEAKPGPSGDESKPLVFTCRWSS